MKDILQKLFVLLIVIMLVPSAAIADLSVTFIDIGQGEAALIQADGKNMLIDAGPNESADALLASLAAASINKIDVLVGTHPHEDHIGGMDEVLDHYDVAAIWMPKAASETQTFENLLLAIKDKGLKITAPAPGTVQKLGKADITVLAPFDQTYDDLNNYSIVLRITYGNASFLFTGDAETTVEEKLFDKADNIDVDVLKVGHHGSNSSTSQAFLDAVSPLWAIISCGKDNTYGYPHSETVARLQATDATILRTDIEGSITFTSDGKGIALKEEPTVGRTNTSSVNVRDSATTKGKKVATLKEGALVNIIGKTIVAGETWYNVDTGSKTGYIRSDLLNILSTDEAAAALAAIPSPKPNAGSDDDGHKYVGNKNSKVFHLPSCHTLPAAKNQVYFSSRDYAIAKGYKPCKNCGP